MRRDCDCGWIINEGTLGTDAGGGKASHFFSETKFSKSRSRRSSPMDVDILTRFSDWLIESSTW